MEKIKIFKLQEEEYGMVCNGPPHGPFIIDLNMDTLSPTEARKLAKWLVKAADWVVKNNKRAMSKGQIASA